MNQRDMRGMRLVLIDRQGTVHEIIEDMGEEFTTLEGGAVRGTIMDGIAKAIDRANQKREPRKTKR